LIQLDAANIFLLGYAKKIMILATFSKIL